LAAALGAVGLAAGCNQPARSPSLPDPLVMNKRPIEGKAEKVEPRLLARAEPPVPALPSTALAAASLPPNLVTVSVPPRQAPGFGQPIQATPAVRSGSSREVPGSPASQPRE
jgi:hypothetical protein